VKPTAAVLGAGSWGTALANLLAKNGLPVRLWARRPELAETINRRRENPTYLPGIRLHPALEATGTLARAVGEAAVVVLATPSQAARGILTAAAPALRSDALLVNAAKGIEAGTLYTMSEVVADVLPASVAGRACTLSGPSFAREVAEERPTAVVVASRSAEAATTAQRLFQTDYLRVYTNDDVRGVELGGALKNVVAIAAGLAVGLGLGHNALAALITRGLAEMTRLGTALGARAITFAGLAGVGDLIATSCSRLSRNFRLGVALGQGTDLGSALAELGQVAEGVPTTRAVRDLARRHAVEMPVTEALYGALYEGASVPETVRALMMRPARDECEEQPGLR